MHAGSQIDAETTTPFNELHACLPLILDLWYSMYVCSHVAAYSQQRSLTWMLQVTWCGLSLATLYELTLQENCMQCVSNACMVCIQTRWGRMF